MIFGSCDVDNHRHMGTFGLGGEGGGGGDDLLARKDARKTKAFPILTSTETATFKPRFLHVLY